jgi:hypothetical protein
MKTPETNDAKKPDAQPSKRPEARTREERGREPAVPELDFANLDLRVEVVEERISPGETNVFDK